MQWVYAVKMSQCVYFDLTSEVVSATKMAAYLGMEPDKVMAQGSRIATTSPVPVCHSWQLHATNQAVTINDQITELLDRLAPLDTRLRDLVTNEDDVPRLVIVRYFNDEHGRDEKFDDIVTERGVLEHIGGQHQMLGWHLTAEQMRYLASIPQSTPTSTDDQCPTAHHACRTPLASRRRLVT